MYVWSFIPQLGEKSGNRVGGSNNNNNNPLCYVVNSPNLEMETGAWKLVHFASSQMNGLQHTSLFVMRGGPGYPYKLLLITTVVGMGSHTVTSGVGSRRLLFLSVWGPILIQKALTTTPVWCPAPAPPPPPTPPIMFSFFSRPFAEQYQQSWSLQQQQFPSSSLFPFPLWKTKALSNLDDSKWVSFGYEKP